MEDYLFLDNLETNITLGSDIEHFIWHTSLNQYIPASYLTEGTKHDPEDIGDGIEIHSDNVTLEHSVPVSTNAVEFAGNVKKAIQTSLAHLREQMPDVDFANIDTLNCSFEGLLNQAPEFTEFGCNPFKTPDGKIHELEHLAEQPHRFAGFHVHIGYPDKSAANNIEVIKMLDYFCEQHNLINDTGARASSYGKSGAYRDTDYGVEYRRLGSNYRVRNRVELVGYLATLSAVAISKGLTVEDFRPVHSSEYKEVILNGKSEKQKRQAVLRDVDDDATKHNGAA